MSKKDDWLKDVLVILKHGGTFLGFSVLSRAIPFLLLPVLTSYIDPYGFGVIALLAVISRLLMELIGISSSTVLLQRFYLLDQTDRSYFFGDSYKIILVNTLILVSAAYLFGGFFESLWNLPIHWLIITIMTAAFSMAVTLTTQLFLLQKQSFKYGMFQLLNIGTTVVSVILLVIVLELSWEGRVLSLFASSLILFLISTYVLFKEQYISILSIRKTVFVRSIIRLGLPLLPGAIGGWALAMTDRIFLTAMVSLDVVGIYAVGVMLAQIIDIFLDSLTRTFYPYLALYGKSTNINQRIMLVQGIYVYVVMALAAVIGMFFVAPILLEVMVDARYHDALSVIGLISLGFMFARIGGVFSSLLIVLDQNDKLMYVQIPVSMVGIALSYILINEYGMVGAAVATAVTGFFSALLLAILLVIYGNFPWIDKRICNLQIT